MIDAAVILPFFHLAGIIIGLGAVTVIDCLGFLGRKSIPWTQTTIAAHHVTKPLIWIGTILMSITWLFLYTPSTLNQIKSGIIPILIANGAFLSLYISPRLDQLAGKKQLLPPIMQVQITCSFLISFSGWWTLVFLTVLSL